MKGFKRTLFFTAITSFAAFSHNLLADSFVNFESPHVSPLSMTPDGNKLLAVNTADNRIQIFSLTGKQPTATSSIAVGLDPVTVRARSNSEAWVVNHISDSISIVNLDTLNVVKTIHTGDEPADVVFAGTPQRAYVTLSQENQIAVYDPLNPDAEPTIIELQGEDPRALTVSPDGNTVYVGIFESGNQSTIIGVHQGSNIVSTPAGPYAGENPPPNEDNEIQPPLNPDLPVDSPKMGLIVRKNASGAWLDDNGADWSNWISGSDAFRTDRVAGWDVVDNDIAAINTSTLSVTYYPSMMNIVMGLAVNPVSKKITAIGTEATNEERFEPKLTGRFVRVKMAIADAATPTSPSVFDINTHLDYSDSQVSQQADAATRDESLVSKSVGDPRAIIWNASGTRAYIAGMGSNNVVIMDANGRRLGTPFSVGEGPTGLAIDNARARLYVLNKFSANITTINLSQNRVISTASFFDPTPTAITDGRRHLYNTHDTSALGQASCGSCHVDSRTDRLAWDLGNPAGKMVNVSNRNCGYGVETDRECHDFHPMKGPMLTQTLQDIIGHEPHHWRGDKFGLEDFNGAFTGLQGAPAQLSDADMQQFEDFLATIHFPPNPYRNFDNTLPDALTLEDHYSFGRFSRDGGVTAGSPLLVGNPQRGLDLFRTRPVHMAGPGGSQQRDNTCVMCHTLPTGLGANVTFTGNPATFPFGAGEYVENAPGPKGEMNLMITGLLFGGGQQVNTVKVPQLRNMYDRRGFSLKKIPSLSGFGYFHDGSDDLDKFLSRFAGLDNDQEVADIIAFLMTFSGSDLPMGSLDNLQEPPGALSKDAHAAVGYQLTFNASNKTDTSLLAKMAEIETMADAGAIGMVAHGIFNAEKRGFTYTGAGTMQSDRLLEVINLDELIAAAGTGAEITFTVVPVGSEIRIGIDRDEDGTYDGEDAQIF